MLQGLGTGAVAGLAGCTSGGDGGDGGSGGGGSGNGATSGSGQAETVPFHFITDSQDPERQKFFKGVFSNFKDHLKQKTGQELNSTLEFTGSGELRPKLNTYYASGKPPALIRGGGDLVVFANRFADLSEAIEANNVPEGVRLDAGDGRMPIHPENLEVYAQWYRQDIYDDAGVSNPTTWDEQMQTNQALMDHLPDEKYSEFVLSNSGAPSPMVLMYGNYEMMQGLTYIERTGPKMTDTRVTLGDNRDKAVELVDHLSTMYNEFSPESPTYSYAEITQLYVNDVVARSSYAGRLLNNVNDQSPELVEVTRPSPTPAPSSSTDQRIMASMNGYGVSDKASTTQKEVAREYLKWFFSTDAYKEAMLAVPPHAVPPALDVLESEEFQNDPVWSSKPGQAYKQMILDNKENLYIRSFDRTSPPSPYWLELVYSSGTVPTMYAEAMLGKKDPEQAVDDAITKLEAELPETAEKYVRE